MNDKLLWQLLDTIRGSAADSPKALSLVLQLLCWWKFSKEQTLPESLLFGAFSDQDANAQHDALRKVQPYARYPFLDEGAWQNLRNPNAVSILIQKICLLEKQGLVGMHLLDDAFYWWTESRSSHFTYAPSLCDLMVSLAPIDSSCDVYVPWETSGQLAARIAHTKAKLWVESQQPTHCAQVLNFIDGEHWELHATDPLSTPLAINKGKLVQFDIAMCIPPMGMKYPSEIYEGDLWERFNEKTSVGNVLQIRHLLAQTQGLIVLAVPSSLLFGAGAERQMREDLVSRGFIRTVIALPAGLCSGTSIPINILVLDSKNPTQSIRFVDANHSAFKETSGKKRTELKNIDGLLKLVNSTDDSPSAKNVTAEDVAQNDFSLLANRYVHNESTKKLEHALKRYPVVELGDFFQILRPRQHNTTSAGAKVSEVLAQDIPSFGYIRIASKVTLFDLESPKAESYFLQPDDILMTFKGAIGKAGIVGDVPNAGQDGWIAGQSSLILRSGLPDQYPAKALLIFLRSPLGQSLLSQIAVGAVSPSIQLSALKNMKIPVPPMGTMHAMVRAFDKEVQIQTEIDSLTLQQAELTEAFWPL